MDPLPQTAASPAMPRNEDPERQRWAALRVALRRRAALARLGRLALEGADLATLRADVAATAAHLLDVPSCRILPISSDGGSPVAFGSDLHIPIPSEEEASEILVAHCPPGREFTSRDRRLLRSLAQLLAQAQERMRLLAREQEARALAEAAQCRLTFLIAAGDELGAALDYEDTLQRLIRVIVPALADAGSLYLRGEDGGVRLVAAGHADPAKEAALWDVLHHYAPDPASPRSLGGTVLITGTPALVAYDPEARSVASGHGAAFAARMRALGVRSYLLVPLPSRERILGVLALLATEPGRQFTRADVVLTEELARRCAPAIDAAWRYERVRRELAARRHAEEDTARQLAQEHAGRVVAERLAAERAALLALHDVTAEHEREDPAAEFVAGELAISFAHRRVTLQGRLVHLTPLEFALLGLLARNSGRVLPTSLLLDRLWSERAGASAASLKVYIHRLRAKLEPPGGSVYIETVRGVGYRFLRPSAVACRRPR